MSAASIYEGQDTLIPVVNAFGNVFEEWQIATAAQTVFIINSFQYTPGTNTLLVFKNGLFQRPGFDYLETNSTRITFTAPTTLADRIAFFAFATAGVAIPNGGGLPAGGSANQILSKINGSDYNAQWISISALAGLLDAPLQNVASANTVDLSGLASTTRNIVITGNTNIAGFQITSGQLFAVRFNGTLTLTNSASLITNKNTDLVISPGDTCFVRAVADNVVEIIAYSGSGVLTASLNYTYRNRAINGDMELNQRGAGTVTASGAFIVDRFTLFGTTVVANAAKITSTIANFPSSIRYTSTAATVPAIGASYGIQHKLEGIDVADLAWGTAAAKPITVSFRCKASLVGTYAISITNDVGTRSYVLPFTINVANTDEYKTFTIPGDTSGVWQKGQGIAGITLRLCLGVGTTFATSAGSWQAGNFVGLTGQTNLVGTNAATFEFTGVQLEAGVNATAFEVLPYVNRIQRCERFYESGTGYQLTGYSGAGGVGFSYTIKYRTAKCKVPTVSYGASSFVNVTTYAIVHNSLESATMQCTATAAGGFIFVSSMNAEAEL